MTKQNTADPQVMDKALLDAIEAGDLESVAAALASGANVDATEVGWHHYSFTASH